mmetsp:Transcript_28877/g.54144  ORF Transcript_28877/g.54144 Transcript_28877/m.54144 type:complete len:398 (+) Transcript_28877:29-1222(+)
MVNYDKNIQGAKRDAARQAHEAKVKAKQDKEDARRAAAKAKREEKNRQLIESIADEIDQSEEKVYESTFTELCQEDGTLSLADPQVIKFLSDHTDLPVQGGSGEKLADALQQVLQPQEVVLSYDQFLALLRENSVADSTAVSKFLETSLGHDSIAKTEAAAHALHVAQKMVRTSFEKEKWDILLHAVTQDLGHMVGLQEFVRVCKRIARCGRLLQFVEFELQEDLPLLKGKGLQQWQAVTEDICCRISKHVPAGPSDEDLQRALEASRLDSAPQAELSGHASGADADQPKCDLCKISGTCMYHAQRASSSRRSSSRGEPSSRRSYSASAGASAVHSGLDAKGQARHSLHQVISESAQLAQRLEEAILAAADAGLDEEELLPAFARLEELQTTAVTCR